LEFVWIGKDSGEETLHGNILSNNADSFYLL